MTSSAQKKATDHARYLRNRDKVLARVKQWQADNHERFKTGQKQYRETHRDQEKERGRQKRERQWRRVLTAYGEVCACCGESEPTFLTLDHINGARPEHSTLQPVKNRNRASRTTILTWLERENWPSGFQILCWNCNLATKEVGKLCPHQKSVV